MQKPKKILLVDDDLMLIKLYHEIIQKAGFNVIEAHDGEEAVKEAFEQKPDLIVLDMEMPKKNGITVLKEIRATDWGKNIPIIMFTCYDTTNADISELTDLKLNYYLLKEAESNEQLIDKIKELTRI